MIGEKIRDLRKKQGLTQEQLAGRELTKSYVSQVELGRIHPSHKALQTIASRLGKPVGYFVENRDDIRTIEVLLKAAEALWNTGRLEDGMAGLQEALTLAERTGRDDVIARIRMTMGQLELLRGNTKAAEAHLETSLSLSLPDEFAAQAVLSANTLGIAAARQGSFHKALQRFQQALDFSRHLTPEEGDVRAETLESYGDFCFGQRQWQSALDLYQEALLNGGQVLPPSRQAELYTRIAGCLWRLGRRDESNATLERTLGWLENVNDADTRASLQLEAARIMTELGRHAEAHEFLTHSLARFRQAGRQEFEAAAMEALLLLADAADNREWLAQYGQETLERPEGWPWDAARVTALRLFSRQAVRDKELKLAESYLDQAVSGLPEHDRHTLDSEFHLVRLLQGRHESTYALWDLITRLEETPPHFLLAPRPPRAPRFLLPR
ncbi:MAG: tetratricopeptide repeat protein [Thermaerobacter sp.]|nr:tetratricopeptide repeat protein [Thermaerobacter sp.]